MTDAEFAFFIRNRITELRLKKDVSEHKMSLDLDKSGSYIRSITCEGALPSTKELSNIISYFGLTPSEFFAPMDGGNTPYQKLCARLRELTGEELEKVDTFVSWLEK